MAKKTGRPSKITKDEKLAILDRYYITNAAETPAIIGNHGIYRKLADFAKSIGYSLEPYDFSRDEDVRAHIAKLTTPAMEQKESQGILTYVPLDITALMNRSQRAIEEVLQERERYFKALHMGASRTIENNTMLTKRVQYLQAKITAMEKEKCEQEEINNILTERLRNTEKNVAYLKRVIRKDVEPERAYQFFQGLTTQEAVIQTVQKSVMTSLDTLCSEDRKTHAEAEKDVDKLDLRNLLSLIQTKEEKEDGKRNA